jgi:hypothetical protein
MDMRCRIIQQDIQKHLQIVSQDSTTPTCLLQMATDSCNNLAALDKAIMAEIQLQEDCDCHNFCNDEWIECVALGEESSEIMCDQSQLVLYYG